MKQLYNYEYATPQVHQVTSITPPTEPGIISTNFQTVNSNSFNKVKEILENNNNYKIYYDNSQNRIKTELVNTNGNKKIKDKYYSAGYERELKYINNSTYTKREINYIEGPDGLVAVFINNQNDVKNGTLYFVDKNHQCSIMALINEKTGEVKEYNYDPWGRRIDPKTNSYLKLNTDPGDIIDKGYTGHEYLPLFGVINMNGRMYDPVIGRVLSPDNYVQGGGVQGLNRYSYCGNNPVMFVDPDGNFLFMPILIGMAYGALIGAGTSATVYSLVTVATGHSWTWSGFGTAVAMGAVGGAFGGGLGTLGSQIGMTQNLAYNILSNVTGNTATNIAFGNHITSGSMIGSIVGGMVGAGFGNFTGVAGGSLKNAISEIGFNAVKGGFSGMAGGAISALVDKKNVGEGVISGLEYGALSGVAMSSLNILAMGTAYKPYRSYGDFGDNGPIYRRGTFLTRAIFPRSGITLGRNLVINSANLNDDRYDPITGWPIDMLKFNQFVEAHETYHYIQQSYIGFGNFYHSTISEYINNGFYNDYCTPNSLEWNAESYAVDKIGNYYK